MRLIGAASIVFTLALTFVISGFGPATTAHQPAGSSENDGEQSQRDDGIYDGRARKNDRHHDAWFAPGAERQQHTERANSTNDSGDEGPPHPFGGVAAPRRAFKHQQQQRSEHRRQKISQTHKEKRFVTRGGRITATHIGLAGVQEYAVNTP